MDLNYNVKLHEKDYRAAVAGELIKFQKVMAFSNAIETNWWPDLLQNFVNLTRRGFDGSDDVAGEKSWSFAGAFLFSLTVITTIGKLPRTYS